MVISRRSYTSSHHKSSTSRVSATSALGPPEDNKHARARVALVNLTQRTIDRRMINRKVLVDYENSRQKKEARKSFYASGISCAME